MKNKIVGLVTCLIWTGLSFSITSCKNAFDLEPESTLEYKQMYQNAYDANAAVLGIYGKLQSLSTQYILLNELRADLLSYTKNDNETLKQLSDHSISKDFKNSIADPRPFYELILNCNDVLKNFKIMRQENKLTQDQFDQRYSDVASVRTWLYLQLGIHFGDVPYITEPFENISDLKNISNFPKLTFDQLLTELLALMESLPYLKPYATTVSDPSDPPLVTNVDGYNTAKMFMNKQVLMGDLYLWQGKYSEAARTYKSVMESYPSDGSDNYFETYKVTYSNANDYVGGGNWYKIFSQPLNERYSNYENVWMLPFDKNFKPDNPFITLFSPSGGDYLVRPSDVAIKNWNDQMRGNTPFDLRGNGYSYAIDGVGRPFVRKMIFNYSAGSPFETTGKWILYRASAMHLHYAEAANKDGRSKLAYALLNVGIKNTFDPTPGVAGRDVTNIMVSETETTSPYYFDAREGEFPRFRSPWYRHTGIRSRVGLSSIVLTKADSTKFFDMSNPIAYYRPLIDQFGFSRFIEDRIVEEGALELAFEGYRWPDLLRIAMRRQKEDASGGVFLYNVLSKKYTLAGLAVPQGIERLKDGPQKWFIEFNWNQ
jgi:starch-binding outer membrane protein, SusD/RagB family